MSNSIESQSFKSNVDAPAEKPDKGEKPDFRDFIQDMTSNGGKLGDTASRSASADPEALKSFPDLKITDAAQKADDRQVAQASDDRTIRGGKLLEGGEFTLAEQEKAAKNVANEIAEKGFGREERNKLRYDMTRAYTGGDKNSPGDEKRLNEFMKQVQENLKDKGLHLKFEQPVNDPEYKKFLEGAKAEIATNQPNMKITTSGQMQLWKGNEMIGKGHYAMSIRKMPLPY